MDSMYKIKGIVRKEILGLYQVLYLSEHEDHEDFGLCFRFS